MNVKKVLLNVILMPVVITLLEDIPVCVILDMRVMASMETAEVSIVTLSSVLCTLAKYFVVSFTSPLLQPSHFDVP